MADWNEEFKPLVLVANGELEPSHEELVVRFCNLEKARVIAVDGGLNYLHKLGVKPHRIIGDFDSVDPSILKLYPSSMQEKLERAKDVTDLVAALSLEDVNCYTQTYLFGALGRRMDHSLESLYYTMSHPGKVQLLTEYETLVGVSPEAPQQEVQVPAGWQVSLIPLGGAVKDLFIQTGSRSFTIPLLDQQNSPYHLTNETPPFSISVGEGDLLASFNFPSSPVKWEPGARVISHEFSLKNRMADQFTLFKYLYDQQGRVYIDTPEEEVYLLSEYAPEWETDTVEGQTISLIPLYGKVDGIVTEGLKWRLQGKTDPVKGTFGHLDKDFLGTSNVALGERVKVSIKSGLLLCFKYKNLIDKEMINLQDHTRTGAICFTPQRSEEDNT